MIDTLYAFIFLLYFYLGNVALLNDTNEVSTTFILLLWISHTLKFGVIAYFLIKFVADHIGTEYTIANGHLLVTDGFITINQREYELKQLKEMKVIQGPLGRMLHFGDIELKFGALGFQKNVVLHDISKPEVYLKRYRDYLTN